MAATKRTIRKTVKKSAKRTAAKAVKRVSKAPTVRSARKSASHQPTRVNAEARTSPKQQIFRRDRIEEGPRQAAERQTIGRRAHSAQAGSSRR